MPDGPAAPLSIVVIVVIADDIATTVSASLQDADRYAIHYSVNTPVYPELVVNTRCLPLLNCWLLLVALQVSVPPVIAAPRSSETADAATPPLSTSVDHAQINALLDQLKQHQDSDPAAAIRYGEQAEPLLAAIPDAVRYGELLLTLARLHVNQASYQTASKYLQRFHALPTARRSTEQTITALKIEALMAREQSALSQAMDFLSQALVIAEASTDPLLIAGVQYEQAIIHFFRQDHDQASALLTKALTVFRASDDRRAEGKALNILAILYGNQSRYDESLQTFLRALEIAVETGDTNAEAALYSNIAVTYDRLGRQADSLEIHRKALTLARRLGDRSSEALSLANIGIAFRELGQLTEARAHFLQAATLAEHINAKSTQSRALSNLAAIARQQQDVTSTLREAQRALVLAQQSGDANVGLGPRRHLAWAHLQLKQYNQALREADTAYALAQDNEDREGMSQAAALRADIYAEMGQHDLALAQFKHHVELKENMFNERSDRTIAGLRAQFESKEKDLAIAALEQDKRLKDSQLQQQELLLERRQLQRNAIIFVLACAFLVAFLIFRRLSEHRLNRRLVQQVAERTAELNRKNQELQKAYELVETRSLTDELTGLSNRRFLLHHLPDDIAAVNRHYRNAPPNQVGEHDLLFFLIDLDHFKSVNDQYGHAAGDMVLMQISQILSQVFRQTDHLIRWGGEEFLVVVRFAKRSEVTAYAERLRLAIAHHAFAIGHDHVLQRTCSIGFACYPCFRTAPEQVTWSQVIDIADLCLYAAKKSSRNAWVGLEFFDHQEVALFPGLQQDPTTLLQQLQPLMLSSLPSDHPLIWQ